MRWFRRKVSVSKALDEDTLLLDVLSWDESDAVVVVSVVDEDEASL